MDLPIGIRPGPVTHTVGDPKIRLAVAAVADRHAEIQLPRVTKYSQHGVVELLGFRIVGAVDS
jgi:hypothetical protein